MTAPTLAGRACVGNATAAGLNGAPREMNGAWRHLSRGTIASTTRDRLQRRGATGILGAMSEITLPMPLLEAASGDSGRLADPQSRSFFRRATVQTRLTIAFCGLGGMSLIGTLLAVWLLHGMQQDTLADLRASRAAGELHAAAAANVVRASVLVRSSDPATSELLLPAYQATDNALDGLHGAVADLSRSERGQLLLQQAKARRDAFRQSVQAAL